MAWTDERVELLKKLWAEGLSASQIERRLGRGFTRNAVIGKVHRLGLSGRTTTSRVKPKRKKPVRQTPRASDLSPINDDRRQYAGHNFGTRTAFDHGSYREPVPVAEDGDIPLTQRRTVETLSLTTCRYPVGDPRDPEFFFCGAECGVTEPYCAHHARIAYAPVQRRRNKPDPSRPYTPKTSPEKEIAHG